MITISIDEKACVGCELCVLICPTKVYSFDAERGVPKVDKPKECFGCRYCAEECPADALTHDGLIRSRHFYHQPYAMNVAAKLGCNGNASNLLSTDPAAIDAAMEDLSVRVTALGAVLKTTLGSGLAGVGTFAGRVLSRQLPRYQTPTCLEDTWKVAQQEFSPAWDLHFATEGETLTVTVKDCYVRELCQKGRTELGGEICTLFANYLAGYLNGMGKLRLRMTNATRGNDQCTYNAKMQHA